MNNFSFKILYKDKKTKARVGEMETSHGKIETPAFVPVGTQASIKSLSPQEIKETGTQIFFVNTYHMMLRPGVELVEKMGGLHKFMNWNGPLITDSGGFQVFSLGFGIEHGVGKIANIFPDEVEKKDVLRSPVSNFSRSQTVPPKRDSKRLLKKLNRLPAHQKMEEYASQAKLVKVTEEGAVFTSHLDGKKILLTPEVSIEAQKKLGADIILAFDECTSPLSDYEYTKNALGRSHRWALKSLEAFQCKPSTDQALFGIIQGGAYEDLRIESAKYISELPFPGLAIGGSLGKSKKDMLKILDWVIPILPDNKPRHLLGIGEIEDIFEIVEKGVDSFDCVMPTRLGRMGQVLIRNKKSRYKIDISNSSFIDDPRPISDDCECYTCQNFSRAYLNHLFRAKELLSYRLATIHNLYFINSLVKDIRKAILEGKFLEMKRDWMV